MKLIYGTLIISSLIISIIYYSNESYAFNAEFIVAICFIIFTSLTVKNINSALTSSMKDRSDQIKEEYSSLQGAHENNFKLLLNYYKKYNNIINNLKQLFVYTVSKSYEMYLQRHVTSINTAHNMILNGFNTIYLLENIYILKYKYFFVSRFYSKLQNHYQTNSSDLLEYLNSINYISNINNKNTKTNVALRNVNIITSSL